jgi:hypothetical protein
MACFTAFLLTSGIVLANTAVADFNGKLGATLGSVDSEDASVVEGSITWPVQESFGIQLDGLYSNIGQKTFGFARNNDLDFGGLGAHFFWRDSEQALLGLGAGYVFSEAVDSYELGLEAEQYFERLTLGAKAGIARISYDEAPAFVENDNSALFIKLYLSYYPADNLLITAIAENRFDNNSFGIELEYALPVRGLSIFANATKGDNNYNHVFVGARYYFGDEKPLKRRHRESDPGNLLPGTLHGINTYTAESHQLMEKYISKQPEGWLDGSGSYGGSTNYTGSSGGTLTINGGLGGTGSLSGGVSGGTLLGTGSSPAGTSLTGVGSGTLTLGGGGTISTGSSSWLIQP